MNMVVTHESDTNSLETKDLKKSQGYQSKSKIMCRFSGKENIARLLSAVR